MNEEKGNILEFLHFLSEMSMKSVGEQKINLPLSIWYILLILARKDFDDFQNVFEQITFIDPKAKEAILQFRNEYCVLYSDFMEQSLKENGE